MFSRTSVPTLEPTQSPLKWVSGVKRPGHEADHSSQCNPKAGACTSAPHMGSLRARRQLNFDVSFEVRHSRCIEPKLLNGKSTVKTQLYFLAVSGFTSLFV